MLYLPMSILASTIIESIHQITANVQFLLKLRIGGFSHIRITIIFEDELQLPVSSAVAGNVKAPANLKL